MSIRYAWLREVHDAGLFRLEYVKTDTQAADTLTKGLVKAAATRHRDTMMNVYGKSKVAL